MSLRCSEISSRVGTKLGLATLAAEAVSASLIMLLMLAILFHLHPADWVCECCSTFRLVGLVMASGLRGSEHKCSIFPAGQSCRITVMRYPWTYSATERAHASSRLGGFLFLQPCPQSQSVLSPGRPCALHTLLRYSCK